jgi:DNA polymerase (family 10)
MDRLTLSGKIIDVVKKTSTVLEIDAQYDHLDLKDDYISMAVQKDVKLVIDSDAHHPAVHLYY